MRVLSFVLSLVLLCLPLAARAQRMPVVLELYTSQGCASCPPADALLSKLATLDGVIALSLHVDYWDYLGWIDSYGQAAHTARQRAYAAKAHQRSVFTPQMIVQGEDMLIGHRAQQIADSIAEVREEPLRVSLRASREAAGLRIRLAPLDAEVGPAEIYVVDYQPSATVEIGGGENGGRRVVYTNVVTSWDTVAEWDGAGEADLTVAHPGTNPVAVIVQRAGLGPILMAAQLP